MQGPATYKFVPEPSTASLLLIALGHSGSMRGQECGACREIQARRHLRAWSAGR